MPLHRASPRRLGRRSALAALASLALVVGAFVLVAAPASATSFSPTPDPTVDGAVGSLRAAIVAATSVGGDIIDLAAGGTYTLTCGGGGALTHGATPLTINGNGATIVQTCADNRVLGVGGSLTLDAVTISGGNGAAGNGAGLFANTGALATLTITNSTFTGNSSTTTNAQGGGIYTGAVTTVTDSTISDNHLTGASFPRGAGIYAVGSSITLTRTSVTGNAAASGAGLRVASGDFTMTDSTVADNVGGAGTSATGGGILAQGGDTVITDSTVSGNTAWGGAGYFRDGSGTGKTVTITGSTFSGNIAGSGGGGGVSGLQPVIAENSTFTGNTGGGVSANATGADFAVTLRYVTVDSNSSANVSSVGNFRSFASVVTNPTSGGTNCTFAVATTTSDGYNYSDSSECSFTGTGDVQDGASPQLGALADNGGPTQTLLPADTSPLVDTIPNAACDAGLGIVTDQRGEARPATAGGLCDMGAVEIPTPEPPVPPDPPVPPTAPTPPTPGGTIIPAPVLLPPRFSG